MEEGKMGPPVHKVHMPRHLSRTLFIMMNFSVRRPRLLCTYVSFGLTSDLTGGGSGQCSSCLSGALAKAVGSRRAHEGVNLYRLQMLSFLNDGILNMLHRVPCMSLCGFGDL